MNDRARAIEILKRARNLLQEQLTERIVLARDAILGEALGLAFPTEIDSIYEQLGARLSHIQSMLANLPPVEEPVTADLDTVAVPRPAFAAPRALAGPRPVAGFLVVSEPAAWRSLALKFRSGDVQGVSSALRALFDLEPDRAGECARFFFDSYGGNADMLRKLFQLHKEIERGTAESVIRLAWECFGIGGLESIGVRYLAKTCPQSFQREENL